MAVNEFFESYAGSTAMERALMANLAEVSKPCIYILIIIFIVFVLYKHLACIYYYGWHDYVYRLTVWYNLLVILISNYKVLYYRKLMPYIQMLRERDFFEFIITQRFIDEFYHKNYDLIVARFYKAVNIRYAYFTYPICAVRGNNLIFEYKHKNSLFQKCLSRFIFDEIPFNFKFVDQMYRTPRLDANIFQPAISHLDQNQTNVSDYIRKFYRVFGYHCDGCGTIVDDKYVIEESCLDSIFHSVYWSLVRSEVDLPLNSARFYRLLCALVEEQIHLHFQRITIWRDLPFFYLTDFEIAVDQLIPKKQQSFFFESDYESETEYEDQMYRSKFTLEQLDLINIMIDGEKDRNLCKKILAKAEISDTDVLNVKLSPVKKFVENCNNFGVTLECTIIGQDERKDLVKQVKALTIKEHETPKVDDYIIEDWVKIDSFLRMLNKLNRGQQHKLCKQLVFKMNDKWLSTFYHNNNNDCRQLIKRFQLLNIESAIKTMSKFEKKLKYFHKVIGGDKNTHDFLKQYEDQMFTLYNDTKRTLNKMEGSLDAFNMTYPQFMNKANNIADRCDAITAKMLTLIDGFSDTLTCASIFLNLMKFVSFSYLITQQCNRTPSNIAALVALILPTGIGNSDLISSLSRAVLGIIRNYDADTTEQGYSNSEADYNIPSSLFNVVKNIVKSSFTTIDDKAYSEMRANTYFLKTISDFLRSCTNIADFFIKSITKIMEYIMSKIMEYYGCLPMFLKDSQFERIIDEYLDLKNSDAFQDCGEDLVAARKVIKLRNEVNEIEATINKSYLRDKTLVYKVAPYIRIIATQLEKAYDGIPPHFKEDRTSHRIKPFFVFISGPPRIGKSKIFQPIIVNEIALRLKLINEYQDPQHYCCFRTAGREFWDGGQGKKVIWYNDLFQGIGNENGLDLALEELASVVDDNPYHMNMSDVKDKSRHYLTAPLVVANAQADTTTANWLNGRVWSGGEHIARRRDINCSLQVNPKYLNAARELSISYINNTIMQDPDHCYGKRGSEMFPDDLYDVHFMDVKTGRLLHTMDFKNAIKYICDRAEEYFSRQDVLTRKLIDNMKSRWEDQMHTTTSRPARRPPITYHPQPLTPRQIYEQEADEANRARLRELYIRESELYRPRRAMIEIEHVGDDGETYYDATEDVYPEDTTRIYDGGCTGSFYVHTLSQIACGTLSAVLASTITNRITAQVVSPIYDLLPMGSIMNILYEHDASYMMLVGGLISELGVAGIKVSAYFMARNRIFLSVLPYTSWIVQCLFARGIHRTFKTIEDILVFGFQHPEYYYQNFVDFVYNSRDHLLHQIYVSRDFMIKSYYDCLDIYSRITFANTQNFFVNTFETCRTYAQQFRANALQAFNDSFRTFKDKMNGIPGWMYFAAGVTIFGATAYLLYKHFKNEDTTEQSHEGNAKAKRRRIARKLGKKHTHVNVQEQSYDTTNREIENIIRQSYCYMALEAQIDDTWITTPIQGMALNIKSNIFVIPHHYWYRFEHCNKLYTSHNIPNRIMISWSAKEKACVYFDALEVCALDYDHTADITYFRIKKFNCGRDISHFFVSENDTPVLHDTYLYGYRPRGTPDFRTTEIIQLGKIVTIEKEYSTTPMTDCILGTLIPSETIHYDYCYHYSDCKTGPGDCTMVLMHTDSRVNGKIMGIHTAGNRAYQTGIAAPIYREDIEEVVSYFDQTERVITMQVDNTYADFATDIDEKAKPYIEQGFNVLANTSVLNINGKLRRIVSSLPSVNKVQHSIVYDVMEEDFGPSTVLPSALRKGRDKDGNIVSPFQKAFNKLQHYTNNIPHRLHMDIVQHCSESIKSWPSMWNKNNARLLTWDECINGYMNLKGLDLTTASGFPYNMYCNGKKPWFDFVDGKYVMKEKLMNDVLEMEQQLEKGLIPPIYFIDTLKDETRPIEKVLDFKTRIFQVGSMAWTILFRKYYGWFMGHCQSTHEFGEMMSGINPTGYDWDLIARRMLAISRLNDNGDYKEYDSTLCHQACTGMSDAANDFYASGEDNNLQRSNLIRTGLILGSINRNHIVECFIIYLRQGNPSGFLLTTIINNFCNMYYNRYAFVKLTGLDLSDFRKYIYAIFFGDDKNATIHPDIQSKFNMNTYKKVIEELGLTYTSASKKEIVEPLIPIEDITFLKRKFIYDNNMNIWRSQLDHDVIMEIPRWSESDPANVDDQMNRFNSCLKELANYSEDEFNFVRKKFLGYINELNTKGYNFKFEQLFTYHYSMYLMYPDHVTTRVPLYELALLGQRQNSVLHKEAGERNLLKISKYTEGDFDEYTFEEQSNVAQNSINFTFTKAEMLVLKKRIEKVIRSNAQFIAPILQKTVNDIVNVVVAACPCPGAVQIYDLVREITSNGEMWNMVQTETITEQPHEEVVPQGMDDDGPQVTLQEQQTTTTFLDVNEMHVARPLPNHIVAGHTVQNEVSLGEFINRPYIVSQFTWTSTNALYSNFLTLEFPYALTSVTSISNKLQNIAYWSPDIEITIRANTTLFHYGGLCFNWIPQGKALNSEYKTMQSCMNSKNWVQLTANARQPLRFIVPYTHYKNKITLGLETVGTGMREDLFTLYGFVSWPLSSAQATTVAPINVSIFARFVNPRMNGYRLDAFVPQGTDKEINSWKDQQELALLQQMEPHMMMIDDDEDLVARYNPGLNVEAPEFVPASNMPPIDEILRKTNDSYVEPKARTMARENTKNPQFRLHYETPIERQILSRRRKPIYHEQGADGEAIGVTKSGLISSTLLNVGDFIGKFVPVPFLGQIASPLSAITATAGYFAKWMGFSVTPSLETPMPMQIRQPHLQKAEDTVLSIPLCPNTGLTAKDFNYVNSYPNEMSITEYVSTPGLIYTGKIAPTQVPGDILFRRAISPDEFLYGDYNTPMPSTSTGNTYYYGVPTYTKIASMVATGWRGSFKFDVHFFSTQFHSCRIAAVYQLYQTNSTPTAPTITNYTNAVNLTMDIQSSNTFSFIIPYDQTTEFLNINSSLRASPSTKTLVENNGYLTFILLNELTSVIATPTDISFQVFVTPCSDFQLIGSEPNYLITGGDARGVFIPQGISDTEMCDYPASSVKCLQETKPIMMSSKDTGYRVSNIHHPFEITSWRQVTNMLSQFTTGTFPISGSFNYTPWGANANAWTTSTNYVQFVMPLFRYSRGSMRFVVMTTDTTATGYATVSYISPTAAPPSYNTSTNFYGTQISPNTGVGTYISNLLSRSPLDVTMPWFSTYKCHPNSGFVSVTSAVTTANNMPQKIAPYITINVSGTLSSTYFVYTSAGDDFLCGWTLPPIRIRYKSPAVVVPDPMPRLFILPPITENKSNDKPSENDKKDETKNDTNEDTAKNDAPKGSNTSASNRTDGTQLSRTLSQFIGPGHRGPPMNRSKRSTEKQDTESEGNTDEELNALLNADVY